MSSALPNQFKFNQAPISKLTKLQLVVLPLLFLVPTPAVAQERLPLLPINQETYSVPPVNNGDGRSFDFQAPLQPQYNQGAPIPQYNQQYNQGFERYSVIVDASGYNAQLLPVVKRVEPTAYIRNFGGRSVIQAGVFSRQQNALQRIQELLASGIGFSNVRVFNNNGQEISLTPNGGGSVGGGSYGNVSQNNSSSYYVAIPTRSEDFYQVEQTVWRSLGQYVNYIGVQRRNQPRGAHIAVGPFAERGQAEQWNAVLRNAGLGNARVYYGR
ncbi:hypothetical protein NIES4071_99920 [Calothrix sp. NIES-4071]|nr:hypothetical protein NIES4071_99920 [Calothrix sp. NIES-4071]BAZ64254.1 hypothetical protein NIES4105_99850 [Calothrix sp. NIES-4105]